MYAQLAIVFILYTMEHVYLVAIRTAFFVKPLIHALLALIITLFTMELVYLAMYRVVSNVRQLMFVQRVSQAIHCRIINAFLADLLNVNFAYHA